MKQMKKNSKMNLTIARKKMMKILVITMILICPLVTEMVSKWTVCGFLGKTESQTAKSNSLVLIRQKIIVNFYFIFTVKLNLLPFV